MMHSEFSKDLLRLFRYVIFVSYTNWMDGASISTRDYEGLIGVEAHKNTLNAVDIVIKRAMDILLSFLLGVFALPVLALAAVLIWLDSPGPIFYAHPRIGKAGRRIKIYKLRTMVTDACSILEKHLRMHPEARQEWEQNGKLRSDPRITRIGRYLRKYSIDELPQLLNVLKGDLSLVGPRPLPEDQVHHYRDKLDVYKSVQPGVTGIWQVSGRSHTSYEERVRFDVYYVRNWSFWLDLYILLRTVWAVINTDGAY
jgi:Undecaprenyl-phosphate galactose phosphotransferase WbaP